MSNKANYTPPGDLTNKLNQSEKNSVLAWLRHATSGDNKNRATAEKEYSVEDMKKAAEEDAKN